MCVCACVCVCVCVCACCVYMYVCTCMCLCVYMHTHKTIQNGVLCVKCLHFFCQQVSDEVYQGRVELELQTECSRNPPQPFKIQE